MKTTRTLLLGLAVLLASCSSISDRFTSNKQIQGHTAKQLFVTGERLMARGEFDTSIKYFESLDSQYPFSRYAEQMLLDLIYVYHRSGDNAAASATAARFIHLYPRAKHVDYAYYMKGVANFEQEHGSFSRYLPIDSALRDTSASKESYNDLLTFLRRYPRSEYAPDARMRMIYLRNIFARKEVYAARFFMRKKAFVAAKNRASAAVQLYSQSPSTPEALSIMVRANRRLGLERQADEALHVLQHNYPKSRYVKALA